MPDHALRRHPFALSWLLLLGACAHGPRAAPPSRSHAEPPAPHLRAAAVEGEAHGHQDSALPSPTAGGDDHVGLGAILAYADLHSPVLAVARSTHSRVEAARAAAAPWLADNPVLSLGAGPRIGRAGAGLDLSASLTQRIQIAGERGARLDAAERLDELTDAQIDQIRWHVHCDVHAAFHRALMEQARARLADQVVTFQREVLRVVERQIAAGEAAPLSLRLAQAEVSQAAQLSVAAEQAFLGARIRLAQLAGWPADTPPTPGGDVDVPRDPPDARLLLAVASERLPGLRLGAARVREAEARVHVARREAWPRPSVGVQYSREGNPSAEGVYDSVLGVLSVPIASFDTNQKARAEAHADASIYQAELDAMRQLLRGQIAEARSEVAAAAKRARAYAAEILPRFEENLVLLRRSFELGEIEILALSTGRERFLRIQSDALGAQLDYFVALAGLERVVGVDLWHDDHHQEPTP